MRRWRAGRRKLWLAAALAALGCLSFVHAQRGSQRWLWRQDDYEPPPPDAAEPAEYYFSRLIYTANPQGRWGPGAWIIDSPKAERHFLQGVRRLTNIHANSAEKYIEATDPGLFNYPWLYSVEVGHWDLSQEEADILREYLLRGGFLVVDDFHGTFEWAMFMRSLRMIFPDRPIVEIANDDPVFHLLYDLGDRFQVPGLQFLYTGRIYELDGVEPHWRGIYDDKGRLMVVINFNMDLGDSWEHADLPAYPERYTAMGYRLGINYIIYDMTH